MNSLKAFWNEEMGQDMVEYTLILGFVALAGAAMITALSPSVSSIWTKANADLAAADAAAN